MNVLPEEAYQLNFTTDCEMDYTLMTDEHFISAAICFEKSDKLMREKKLQIQKAKYKQKSDSSASFLRTDQSRNDGAKKHCTNPKE